MAVGIALGRAMGLDCKQPHAGADHQEERVACLLGAPCPTHVASCPTLGPYLDDLASTVQQSLWLSKGTHVSLISLA